ncbi:MAG: hypothetical protein IPJ01_10805 [Micavibrio sp.]|nr:hypothetical protein [Micavibrio sp.]
MSKAIKINGEIHFKRRVSNTNKDTVMLIAYLNYERKTFSICQPSQESVFFGKDSIEYDLAKVSLLKDALLSIKRELKLK